MPSLIADDIVGVQPMSGPMGQIFTMRARYSGFPDPEQLAWKGYLKYLIHEYTYITGQYLRDPTTGSHELALAKCLEMMQNKYPGNYVLELVKVPMDNTMVDELNLVFDTPEDESFFMLQYSEK
jgi:hypothetical protein